MARRLTVEIVGDSRKLERSFQSAGRSAKGFSVGLGTLAKSAAVIGGVTAAVGGISGAVRIGVGEFSDASKAAAQTAAAIKSTGAIAHVTAKQVDDLATSIQNYSGIDDEAVKAGENLLLTFKNVRNEAGKGNAIFDRATKAAVNLSVAGFGSIESTAKQLGKALNDPIKGMTALGRAGVTFTQAQRDQIKALTETGHTLQAQKLILREVESQVGGSARALGQTLPGQLARLRESFKNTVGDLVGRVAPALTGALGQVNAFLDDLGRARTVRTKLRVVLDRLEGLAQGLTDRIGDAVAAIDWDAIWARARGVADGLQRRLEQVDFSALGRRIGDAFSDAAKVALPAAKDLADRISQAVDAIDWEKLGRAMGPGLASAVAVAIVTLTDPGFWARNWDLALAVASVAFGGAIGKVVSRIGGELTVLIVRALERVSPAAAAAFRGLAIQAVRGFAVVGQLVSRALAPLGRIVTAVFGRLGRLAVFTIKVLGVQAAINAVVGFGRTVGSLMGRLARSITGALDRAWEGVERGAIRAALRVVEPFTHIPGPVGAPFRKAKEAMQAQLDAMVASSRQAAQKVSTALASVKSRQVTLGVSVEVNGKAAGGTNRSAAVPTPDLGKILAPFKTITDLITRALALGDKATDDAATKARAAARRRAQKVAAARAAAAQTQRDGFDELIASIGLKVDMAAATRGFADDLRRNTQLQNAIRAQIKVEGRTTDLATQLLQAQTARSGILAQQAQAAATARARTAARIQSAQFSALGLTGTGDAKTPTAANLRKQLEQLTARLGPDVAPKIAGQLARIGKVLTGSVGKVTEQTRAKILELFQTIRGTLNSEAQKDAGPGFRKTGFKDLIGNVSGLTSTQIKQLRSAFVQTGPGGSRPTPGFGAFGLAFPTTRQTALAGAGAGGPLIVHVDVDGRTVATVVEPHVTVIQDKNRGRRAASRRGVTPGI